MKQNIGSVDGITRALGGVPLCFAAVFAFPGMSFPTLERLCVWAAFLVGAAALCFACSGHCSWYAGILITSSAYILLIIGDETTLVLRWGAACIALAVGLGALFTRAAKRCPMNAVFRISPL